MASHLVETLLVLAAVCVFAVVVLRWGLPRFAPQYSPRVPLRVLSRLTLEPRRSLLVVRVGERTMVLGSSEAGVQLLAELEPGEARAFEPAIEPIVSRETSEACR